MAKRVATYLRVSLRRWRCAVGGLRSGWDVARVFADHGVSGAKGREQRPAFDALCKAVARREVDLVAAWAVDRVGRLIAGITRRIMRDFAVDPGRVHVAGLSAGGAAAVVMGATYPDLYAGIGVHSGLAYGAARDMLSAVAAMRKGASTATRRHAPRKMVPTIVFHGDRDATVNPLNATQIIEQAQGATDLGAKTVARGVSAAGLNYTRATQADQSGRVVLEQWTLHGAGHAWSGGSAAGSFTEPRGPEASREMLRFFGILGA